MEEAPENSKESSYAAHASGMNEYLDCTTTHGIHFSFGTVIVHAYCTCNYRCLWFDHLILCAFWWWCISKMKCRRTCVM